ERTRRNAAAGHKEETRRLTDNGGSVSEIAKELDVSAAAVYNYLEELGMKPNPPTIHGNTGVIRSEESRQKISEAHTGLRASEEAKQHMSEAQTGRHHSEETKRKISASNQGRPQPPLTEEQRQKLREGLKRRWERQKASGKRITQGVYQREE